MTEQFRMLHSEGPKSCLMKCERCLWVVHMAKSGATRNAQGTVPSVLLRDREGQCGLTLRLMSAIDAVRIVYGSSCAGFTLFHCRPTYVHDEAHSV